MTVMPEVPANAPAETVSVPAETSVAPVKVLAPERVRLPEPSLVNVPVPLMIPLIVWAALLPYLKTPSLVIAAVKVPPLRRAEPPTSRTPASMSKSKLPVWTPVIAIVPKPALVRVPFTHCTESSRSTASVPSATLNTVFPDD